MAHCPFFKLTLLLLNVHVFTRVRINLPWYRILKQESPNWVPHMFFPHNRLHFFFFFLIAALLLRAILKLPFGERLARWLPQPVKMFLLYYSFLQTKQKHVATQLKNQALLQVGPEGLEPGDCTGGLAEGEGVAVITQVLLVQAQSRGEAGAQKRGDQKDMWKYELSWGQNGCGNVLLTPRLPLPAPSLIHPSSSNYITFLPPGVPAAVCSGPSSVSRDLSLTAESGHVVPAFPDGICTAPPPRLSSSA